MTDWASIYTPAFGAPIEGVAFQPITCDTPDVLRHLQRPSFWYSGSICIGFKNGHQIDLTWDAIRLCLTQAESSSWRPFSLDRINMSWEEPWGALGNASLHTVQLFDANIELGQAEIIRDIVAARHDFACPTSKVSLWVCTGIGRDGRAGDGDELYVGLEPPTNHAELTPAMTLSAQA